MWLQTALIKSTVGNKIRPFPSPFQLSTSSCLTLEGAFRSNGVAACSTALRSATEEKESGGYVGVPCPSKMKQHSSTADRLKFWLRHQISYDGTHTEQILTSKIKLCSNSYSLLKICQNYQLK